MATARAPGYFGPPSPSLRQDGMQKFESGYKVNGGVNGKTGKRHKLKQKLSSSKRNSGESDQWTSSLVQDHEGNLHDPEYMEQAASRTSFQSLRPRQRTTSRLSRSRASSISSSSSSASDADLPNAKYAASTSASTTAKPVDPVVMPGLPPGVTTGGLGVSISGGQANHVYDSVNSEATPRIRLTSGLYPSSHSKHTASTKTRSVSDNVSHRPNGSMQASSHFAPSLAPTSTSFQSIPATSAISPAYNPYQYIPTTATRQPFTYKPPTRNTSGPRSQSTSVAGSSRPPNHRTLSNDSAVSDPNIIDMSSSAQRSSSLTPRTQSIRQTLPSIVLSQEEEPPVVRQIESDYVPTLDNPERHKNSNHKGGFGSVVGKIEVDMRFALFRARNKMKK